MKKGTNQPGFLILMVIFLAILFAASCKKDKVITDPTLNSSNVTNITETTASSGGTISSDGGAVIIARGVCWAIRVNPDITDSKTRDGQGKGSFTSIINGLNPGTTYHLRAYATNSSGTSYGDDVSFTTQVAFATLTTEKFPLKTSSSATSGGNITNSGGAEITDRGVCWSISANPTINDSKSSDGSGIGSFTSSITGLSPGVTYHVRAYATNSKGTCYGDDVTFTTDPVLAALTTNDYSALFGGGATSGGVISSDGGTTVTARGVCWNTSPGPTISSAKTSNGTGTGSFISNITGLNPATTYYTRAYAINSVGTAYGNEVSFTTPAVVPTVSAGKFTLGNTQYVGGWGVLEGMVESDGGAAVTDRGICWNTIGNPTIADFKTSVGPGSGIFSTSWSWSLNQFSSGTTFYVRTYATNSAGTGYSSNSLIYQ